MSTPLRPNLKFTSFDEMIADAKTLHAGPYDKGGQWDLAMILDHLAKSMETPFIQGKKNLPWPAGPVARFIFHQFARREVYPLVKLPMPKQMRPTAQINIDLAYSRFITATDKLNAFTGDTISCPPLGWIPFTDFRKVQLLHGAHHLSFLKRQE